jgi:hypothetical protein
LVFFTGGRILDLVSSILAEGNLNDPHWIAAPQKPSDLVWVPDRCGQPYPLKTRTTSLCKPFQTDSKLDTSPITSQFVDLIDYDCFDVTKM